MNLLEKSPIELAELRLKLADDYAKAGELKVALLRLRAMFYESYRPDHKSDASLERAWELTDDGLNLMELREKMKSIEHKLSAIRSLLETRNLEARNQY
jgi:hypothetical protein